MSEQGTRAVAAVARLRASLERTAGALAQPDLDTLAETAGLSRFHLHRLFTRWAGITPKDFVQCLTVAHAKKLLRDGESVLDAALDSGLSGPGRLHDLCVGLEAATPGEWKSGGAGWTLTAGFAESPFGVCLIAQSPRGICHLSFPDSSDTGAGNAALFAVALLALSDAGLQKKLSDFRAKQTEAVLKAAQLKL